MRHDPSFFTRCGSLALVTLCVGLMNRSVQKSPVPKASAQSLPTPQLFVEGVFNTEADEFGPAFSPDGNTFYFTKRINRRDSEFIRFSRFENGKWRIPEIAEFSGKYFDKEPFVTPDGKRLL
jgi:hypothetical protein